MHNTLYFSIVFAVVIFSFTLLGKTYASIDAYTLTADAEYGTIKESFETGSMLFGGDVMLGRTLEDIMATKGNNFPFSRIETFVNDFDIAVANFEASVPEYHRKTKSNELQFSVKADALKAIKESGFDVLSLSNNHALDYGSRGYANTLKECRAHGLICSGHPTEHKTNGSSFYNVGDTRVGVLMLHMLVKPASTSTLSELIETLKTESDVQIVFIHWGEEYTATHTKLQSELAHLFVDTGIDVVIGHHPHVMQDIEMYKGKPIFYSLGNLIFDQYFSDTVQIGYFVSLEFKRDGIAVTLTPYDSLSVPSQPALMGVVKKDAALKQLMNKDIFTEDEIKNGAFTVPYDTHI